MAYRRRSRRRSPEQSIIADTKSMAARLPWWGALLLGVLSFILLYGIVPAWLAGLGGDASEHVRPAVNAIVGQRIEILQWTGIVCLVISLVFAVRNYVRQYRGG